MKDPEKTIKTNRASAETRKVAQAAAHTAEPWSTERDRFVGANGETIGRLIPPPELFGIVKRADFDRIVACVNACAGINPDAVPDMLAALYRATAAISLLVAAGNGDRHDQAALAAVDAAIAKASAI